MLYPVELRALNSTESALANLLRLEVGRGRGIRTPDPLLPKQVRYQTAPCPESRSQLARKSLLRRAGMLRGVMTLINHPRQDIATTADARDATGVVKTAYHYRLFLTSVLKA